MANLQKYKTIQQVNELYPAFTINQLDYLKRNRYAKKAEKVFMKFGRTILMNVEQFEIYLDDKQA